MKNATKLPPEQRKALILSAAIEVANKKSLAEVSFGSVSTECTMKTTPRTVAHYFKIGELRKAIVADVRSSQEVRQEAVAMGIG